MSILMRICKRENTLILYNKYQQMDNEGKIILDKRIDVTKVVDKVFSYRSESVKMIEISD